MDHTGTTTNTLALLSQHRLVEEAEALRAMWSFDSMRPRKLEERGDRYVSEAQRLLEDRGAELTPSRRQPAEDLLSQ
jgi:hypothetical protein